MLDNISGSFNLKQRIRLTEWLVPKFKHIKFMNIFSDSEFSSAPFIGWLICINFIMLIKGNIKIESVQLSLSNLSAYMLKQTYLLIRKRMRKIFNQNLFL